MKKTGYLLVILAFLISVLLVLSRNFNPSKEPEKLTSIQGQTILAAGDIGLCGYKEGNATGTAKLLGSQPGTILTLGDNTYYYGLKEEFDKCFDPTWGKYKDRIFPSIGDHEYAAKNVVPPEKPYYDYFGKRAGEFGKGWYSFNLGSWHLIAVNTQPMTTTEIGDNYKLNLEQMEWLKKDLEQNKTDCTLIYGHNPRFSSSAHGTSEVAPMWELAYLENVDVILNGDAHVYERFAPQNPKGELDAKLGIREFVVGTGGGELGGYGNLAKNSEVITNRKFGVLKLVLGKGEYEWEFLSTDGSFVDRGISSCH